MLCCTIGAAQTKVGTVDVNFILGNMPELSNVQKTVDLYGNQLDADLAKKTKKYDTLINAYKAGIESFTPEQLQEKQNEIVALENDINVFRQNGAKLMALKRDDALRPLYQKIGQAVEKIAKAGGYTQILQTSANMAYLDKQYDITLAVIKELGIVLKEE